MGLGEGGRRIGEGTFLCPRLPLAGVGHIAFRRGVTSVYAYITFVTRFKFTCKFRCVRVSLVFRKKYQTSLSTTK